MYSKLLAEALAADGADVVVATEAFPNTERLQRICLGSGTLTVDRLFPLRAGGEGRNWRTYVAYAWQNVLVFCLPRRLARAIRETGADRVVVLVHCGFFFYPNLMRFVLGRMRRQLPYASRLIVDVRGRQWPDSLASTFARFDAAIGCSQMISERLRALLPGQVDVAHIPIPFEPGTPPDDKEVGGVLAEHGLGDTPYVLNPNGIRELKRYPEMLEVVRELRRIPGHEDTILVTIGPARDWKTRDDAAVAEGLLKYVGVVPNRAALALAKGAKATLILSPVEGMPRSALETLGLGKPIVAPPISEFVEHIPSSVSQSDNPGDIARQIVCVSEKPAGERYPLEIHSTASLVAAYRALEPGVTAKPGVGLN